MDCKYEIQMNFTFLYKIFPFFLLFRVHFIFVLCEQTYTCTSPIIK